MDKQKIIEKIDQRIDELMETYHKMEFQGKSIESMISQHRKSELEEFKLWLLVSK